MASNGVENQAYNGSGIDWSQFSTPQKVQAPASNAQGLNSKLLPTSKNPISIFGKFLGNSAKDLGNTLSGVAELPFKLGGDVVSGVKHGGDFSELGNDVKTMGTGIVNNYKTIAKHPMESFLEHPLNTTLAFAPALGGAGAVSDAVSSAGTAGEVADAATAIAPETAGETTPVAEAGNRSIPTQQNLATRMRTGNLAPEDLQGNAGFNLDQSNRLKALEQSQGYHGSAAMKVQQIAPDLATQDNLIKQAVAAHPGAPFTSEGLSQAIQNSLQDENNTSPAATHYNAVGGNNTGFRGAVNPDLPQMDNALQKAQTIIKNTADEKGNLTMGDLYKIRQQLGESAFKGEPSPADLVNQHIYHGLGDVMADPEAGGDAAIRGAISKQGDLITTAQQYGKEAASNRALRGRTRLFGVSVPVDLAGPVGVAKDTVASTLQKLTGGTADYAPAAGGADATETASAAGSGIRLPIGRSGGGLNNLINAGIGTAGIARLGATNTAVNGLEQGQQQQMLQGVAQAESHPADLTAPSSGINQILGNASGNPADNPTGYSPEELQNMITHDIATTGGKNYTQLNRLLGIAQSSAKGQQLSTGAVSALTSYNGALTGLGLINSAYQSASPNKVVNTLSQEIPIIAKAFGLSPTNKADIAQLQAMLPTIHDNAAVAQQKLVSIKQQLDARAESAVSTEQSKSSPMSAVLGNLTGAGAQ